MTTLSNHRLPKGSTILITGITGYIGAWVASEALSLGYNVRGAVRSPEKAAWLQKTFDAQFGAGRYSAVKLDPLSDKAQLSAAVKGVQGIAHIAINNQVTPEPVPYIPDAIAEATAVLDAAKEDGGVKAVVLTSSSMAAVPWGFTGPIPRDNYSEEFVKLAWDKDFQDPGKMWVVYGAAKTQAEQAAWKWVADNRPSFAVNTVLPSCNFGPPVSFEAQGYPSTAAWPFDLFNGDLSTITFIPPQFYVDVRDDAKLHVAALVDPDTDRERLFGFANEYNWNKVLAVFRKMFPDRKFISDIPDLATDKSIPPTESALKALKDVYGQNGWTSMETSLKDAGYDKAKA